MSTSRWRFAFRISRDYALFTAMVAVPVMLLSLVIALGIEYIGDGVNQSVWAEVSGQVPRWFLFGMGAYIGGSATPLHIAHGRTRREFTGDLLVGCLGLAALAAALVPVGFGIESLAYAVIGAPMTVGEGHLFSSAAQVHLVYLESLVVLAVWCAAGAAVGLAFYLSSAKGWLVIPLLLPSAVLVDLALGAADGPVAVAAEWLWDVATPPLAIGVLLCLAAIAIPMLLVRLLLRDLPLASKAS